MSEPGGDPSSTRLWCWNVRTCVPSRRRREGESTDAEGRTQLRPVVPDAARAHVGGAKLHLRQFVQGLVSAVM